ARARVLLVQGRQHAARGGDALDGADDRRGQTEGRKGARQVTRLSLSRRAVTRAMRGSRSTPIHSRPRDAATRPTVPAPAKGSRTGPRFLLPSSTVLTTGSGIASQILSGWERGSGSIQHSVLPRGCTT